MKKIFYLYDYLDSVITHGLNPANSLAGTEDHFSQLKARLNEEECSMFVGLKYEVFKLHDETASRALVKKFHDALLLMIAKNYDNLQAVTVDKAAETEPCSYIADRLQRILETFEKEFFAFLGPENNVPLTILEQQKADILARQPEMVIKLSTGEYGAAPEVIVMEAIDDFVDKVSNRIPISLREANYMRELVDDVVNIGAKTSITGCPVLNELLIYWNLNSRTCIRYFTQGTERALQSCETADTKIAFLRLELKKLDVIPEKANFVLNPDFPSVKDYCSRWLNNELKYWETKSSGFMPIAQEAAAMQLKEKAFKVVVEASVDQIGLILRALDETRIVVARSMSAVFKAIVPYLSTPFTDNLNWNRTRTASYPAEERDKDAAIDLLQRIIEKIKSY